MERTKFNVDKNLAQRTYEDIIFDSKLEMNYYRDVLLPMLESGELSKIELQKKYVLQDGFKRNDQTVRPIIYIADFYLEYSDGSERVVDIKGMADSTAKIKRKLFWAKYPDIDYVWITYCKKYGGWGSYDHFKNLRRDEKRKRTKELKENEDGKD